MSIYTVDHIDASHIDTAYVLLQAAVPSLTLDAWRGYFRGNIAGETACREEAFIVRDGQGYLRGLALAMLHDHVVHGRTLDVSLFVVISIADEFGVADELLTRLFQRARTQDCGALRVWNAGYNYWERHLSVRSASIGPAGLTLLLPS